MTRLDQVLVERGICQSREKAQRAILAGLVRINQRRASKNPINVPKPNAVPMD